MPSPELITIQADIRLLSEKAALLEYNGEEFWVPKSQVEFCYDFDPPKITMPVWLAKEKGIV